VPTVGLNVQIFKRSGVTCKVWDMGGQAAYRSEWSRYARGCGVIVVIVDTQQPDDVPVVKRELHQLLEDRELATTPLLVLANKTDLGPKVSEQEVITGLNLDYFVDAPWLLIPASAKRGDNVDKALQFLIKHAK
jgi:Arf/Sar family protein